MIVGAVLLAGLCYGLYYFDYLETPTEDFIGNFRPRVAEYLAGGFPGSNFKMLPVYPLLLSAVTALNPFESADVIYSSALFLNITLLLPFLVAAFLLYRKFLGPGKAAAALLFLAMNPYTVYGAVNSELEMSLALFSSLAVLLSLNGSALAYPMAFLTAATKWDSVFAVPAAMFRDVFERRRFLFAVIAGGLAASGVAVWMLLSASSPPTSNPYIKEIASRGPNIYRYIVDCFLILSGYVPWMATHAYFTESVALKIPLFAAAGISILIVLVSTVWGAALLLVRQWRKTAPLSIFFSGYVLVHMVYQNTKERYVMPVLWVLVLLLFYGMCEGLYPYLRNRAERLFERRAVRAALAVFAGCAVLGGIALYASGGPAGPIAFAAVFAAIFTVIILHENPEWNLYARLLLALCAAAAALFMTFYGVRTMDHYSLRRVEFKKAALWFNEHAGPSDSMLISEVNVPNYYSRLEGRRYIGSTGMRSADSASLVRELREKKITYVFVDDFYIRRLAHGDKNAVDRKAALFKEIRDDPALGRHFEPVARFETRGGIHSTVYRFVP